MNNLQTEFSLEDIEIARNVLDTYRCGLSRVALNAPEQVSCIGASQNLCKHTTGILRITYRTLKLQYALEVWLRAIAISQENPGSLLYYWWLNWKNCANGFRTLVYHESAKYYNVDQEKLIADSLDLLRTIADSGEIKVHEYCHSNLYTSCHDFCDICEPRYEVVVDAPTAREISNKVESIADYRYNKTDVNYSWNEIKDYFTIVR